MKKLVLALILVLVPVCSYAVDVCESMDNLAATVMQNRQAGASMADMMRVARNLKLPASLSSEDAEKVRRVVITIVESAYEVPRYSTPDYQLNAIIDFRNTVYKTCNEVLNSN